MTRKTSRSDQSPRTSHRWPRRLAIGAIGSLATLVLVLAATGSVFGAKPAPVPPQSFGVTGLTSTAAGTTQTIKVTALVSGKPNPSYRGSIILTSTDGTAVLPGRYQFTSADKGVRSFSVQLKTAGPQTVTATDVSNSAIQGGQTATVLPAAAATFSLSSLSGVTAGTAQDLTLTVRDAFDNLATNYRGTVRALSSDSQATLPADYAFTATDAGAHTFSVTLKTVGQQTVGLSDTASASLAATAGPVAVTPAAAASLVLAGLADGPAGDGQSVSVTALDAYGNLATGYRGTVALSSDDAQATLPANHAFTAGDAGVRQFSVTLKTAGPHTVTVTDTGSATLTSSQSATTTNATVADLLITTNVTSTFEGDTLVTAGQPFSVTFRLVDAYGNTAKDYEGQLTVQSTDITTTFPGGNTGGMFLDLWAADGGTKTITGVTHHRKRIYDQFTRISAYDGARLSIPSAAVDFQVLPGPAVRYSDCGSAYSASSYYQQVVDPIGVNDALGFTFQALDAYGNDATNATPNNPFAPALPGGYQATAPITTSDAQALFEFNLGAVAPFVAGGPARPLPEVQVRFRTAGNQTFTITDPINPALTITCPVHVRGPQAFNGTINVMEPRFSGSTIVNWNLHTYLPPSDTGLVIENLAGPHLGDVPIGTVGWENIVDQLLVLKWDLNPADASQVIRCNTTDPCAYGGLNFTYRIRDAYGNTSDGAFSINTWLPQVTYGTMVFSGNGTIGAVTGAQLPTTTSLSGLIVGVRSGEVSVRVGDQMITMAVPGDSTLLIGAAVSFTIRTAPLVVSGTLGCTPDVGVVCEKAGFATVELLDHPDPSNVNQDVQLRAITAVGMNLCGIFSADQTACPSVLFRIAPLPGTELPGESPGSGFPPLGRIGVPYSFQFLANSSIGEPVGFKLVDGTHPPLGLTLHANGLLDGTPTTAGTISFQVVATGQTSGASSSGEIFTISIYQP